MRRRIAASMAAALLLTLVAAATVWLARRSYWRPGPASVASEIVVPHGSPAVVAEVLQRAGVIDSALAFRIAAALTRSEGPLHAGELSFSAGASLAEALAVLRQGRPVQHRVTIPEGLTAAQIAVVLDRAEGLSGQAVLPEEGMLLPETYAFARGDTREAVASRAHAAMQRALTQAWASRSPGLPYTEPRDLLVLASLIERETARPDERAHVAGVFVNRLRQGMRLQSDPTVAYAVDGGSGALDRKLTRADLEWPNPYNTYLYTGLPPGPIASPGLASLQAAAQPLQTDDLYFVADGTGGHAFARTLEEHRQNVLRWRTMRDGPG